MLTILDPKNPADNATWRAAYNRLGREPFLHPSWIMAFLEEDQSAVGLLFEQNGEQLLFPVLKRKIGGEAWCPPHLQHCTDLGIPQGYGGPRSSTTEASFANAFFSAFDAWATELGVASVFCRLSLFEDESVPWPDAMTVSENIVVTVRATEEEQLMAYKHKVRKNIKKAKRSGLKVRHDPTGQHLDSFLKIYSETMQRRNALDSYRFAETLYKKLITEIPEGTHFIHIEDEDGEIVSTELVLLSDDHMYSFLGGTDQRAFPLRANDLLKHEMIRWGAKNGKKNYVLGGGYQGRDGIFEYKRTFEPEGILPFQIGRRVFSPALYQELVEERKKSEPPMRENFFPAYRA